MAALGLDECESGYVGKAGVEFREGHPGVSFGALAGGGLRTRQTLAQGKTQRRLLSREGGPIFPVGSEKSLGALE